MKIIIRYCLPWGNFSNQAIQADADSDVSDLRLDIEKKFNIKPKKQILKYKRDGLTLKLIPGWPLSHYGLTDKAIVHLENLENQNEEDDTEIYKRDATNKGGYFAKLGILNKIEEEEDDEDRYSRHSSALMSFSPSFPNVDILSGESGSSDEESSQASSKRKGSYFLQKQLVSPGKGKEDVESLIRATKGNHLENVQEMLKLLQTGNKDDEDTGDHKKKTPKDTIDHRGEQGWNSLHWAIYMGHLEIVNEFLKFKPDVNLTTSDGWTPLQLAVYKNQIAIVKALLKEERIKINQETTKTTALHIAAKNGKVQLVTILLEHGADPTVKNSQDSTPFDVASNDKVKKILQDANTSKIVNQKKVVVDSQSSKPPIVKGLIFKKSEHLMKMNHRYIVLNPIEGTLIQYLKIEDYPYKPRRVIPLKSIKEVKRKKAGLFDKNLCFIQLTYKKALIFACYQEEIANKWVDYIKNAITYFNKTEDLMKNEISKPSENKMDVSSYFGENTEEIELNDVKSSKTLEGSRKSSQNEENSLTTKDASPDSSSSNNERDEEEAKEAKETTEQLNQIVDEKINFSSFEIMKELGAGAFGKVFKVRKKDNKKIYAIKALRKRPLIVQRQLKYALTEANVLKRANNPFVLGLHYAFQTREYMYFVLDYCPGGDLSLHLIDKGTFTEDETRFYIAELILAIEYLHSIDVIYRDLKPENILVSRDGHIKLADFGLSKEGVADKDVAKSFCGSPAYLSPEMLKNKGVGKAADVYGIGTVMYEMLIGESPYYSDDIPELYSKIGKAKLELPKSISPEARNLLTKLLHKNPSHRIGVKDKAELKNDPFFKGINWEKLAKKEVEPPKLNILEDDEQDLTVDPRSIFNDMDYNENEIKTNRVKNFTFIKKDYF